MRFGFELDSTGHDLAIGDPDILAVLVKMQPLTLWAELLLEVREHGQGITLGHGVQTILDL